MDNTTSILQEWQEGAKSLYYSVNLTEGNQQIEDDEIFFWSSSRLEYMSHLRQKVLENARKERADYLFVCIIIV